MSDSSPPSAPRGDDPELASWIAAEEKAARANPRRVLQIRRAAGVGGAMLVLVGAAVWAGWLWNLPALTQLLTQTGSMKRWTALTIALVGIGIALPTLADRPAVRFLGGALGWLAAAIGISFLIGYATGIELPHDNWFGYAPTPGWTHPGRPAVLSAAGMVPLGLGLALQEPVVGTSGHGSGERNKASDGPTLATLGGSLLLRGQILLSLGDALAGLLLSLVAARIEVLQGLLQANSGGLGDVSSLPARLVDEGRGTLLQFLDVDGGGGVGKQIISLASLLLAVILDAIADGRGRG